MKHEFGYCHMFGLVNVLAGFVSGAEIISKFVCPGDSVVAFQNITFNNCSSVVSLYISSETNILTARWTFENCSRNETLLPDYNDRVFLYSNGIISIHNVHPWDEAHYIVISQMGNINMEYVVQIIVMAAPTNDCIPKISQHGSSLFASLNAHSCGKPVATLYWKEYGDVPNTSGPLLKLNPRNQDGTFYACIEGPALTCVRNALNICSKFTIGGAGIQTKHVCSGDSVQAFQNIIFSNCSSVVSLYISSETNILTARWTFENCSRNETVLPDYNDRVFLYRNGTISIHNVHPWDEAKYIVISEMGNNYMEDVVQIIVMAAPTYDCIPNISQHGSSLFASLNARSCGKPVATLYWKGYGDVPNTSEPVLKLNPRNQDGTYYACIEGPALTCVKNALDICSKFTIGGAGTITKYVCARDSVQAFQNIIFNNCSSVVSLYISSDISTLIARWSFENCIRNETFLPDYNDRVFLFRNGTISIHNVHPWDEAKYIVIIQMGNIYMEDVVQIIVMAAPTDDCIPKISQQGSSLFTSLNAHSCGKPVPTLYWKEYGDVPNTSEPVLKLNPGNEDGTYYACIEGPALTCVRNAMDICSNFTIRDKSPPIVSETCDVRMAVCSIVGMVSGILLTCIVIFIRKRCKQTASPVFKQKIEYRRPIDSTRVSSSSKAIIGSEDQSDDYYDALDTPLLDIKKHRATYYDSLRKQLILSLELLTNDVDSFKWEEMKQWLNDEQQQVLKNDCDDLLLDHIVRLKEHHEQLANLLDALRLDCIVPLEEHHGQLTNLLDAHENNHQVSTPTLGELSVTLTQQFWTEIDANQMQSVSTQHIFNDSQHSDKDGTDYQAVTPTSLELPFTSMQRCTISDQSIATVFEKKPIEETINNRLITNTETMEELQTKSEQPSSYEVVIPFIQTCTGSIAALPYNIAQCEE